MKRPFITTCLLALFAGLPTGGSAQSLGGGSGGGIGGGSSNPAAPQPRARIPDFAPPAVPGAGGAKLSTMPPVPKIDTGDPTTELFTAINGGDYNGAQDAVGRGADVGAQNNLGESPLDLSIALNRTNITFMLLNARAESGGDTGGPAVAATAPGTAPSAHKHGKVRAIPARMVTPPRPKPIMVPTAGNNPGTPNADAGFLGFGQH